MHQARERNWLWTVVDILLAFMVSGPLLAPYFYALDWPLFPAIGAFIYRLGFWICPQPEKTYFFAGQMLSVCYRCLAALLGLLIIRAAYHGRTRQALWIQTLNWPVRIGLTAIAFSIWTLDVRGEWAGLWVSPAWVLVLNGLPLGLGIGLVVFGLIAHMQPAQNRTAKPQRTPGLALHSSWRSLRLCGSKISPVPKVYLTGVAAMAIAMVVNWAAWLVGRVSYLPERFAEGLIEHTPPVLAVPLVQGLGAAAGPLALAGGLAIALALGGLAPLVLWPVDGHWRNSAIPPWTSSIAGLLLWGILAALLPLPTQPATLLVVVCYTLFLALWRWPFASPALVSRREFLQNVSTSVLGLGAIALAGGIPVWLRGLAARQLGGVLFPFQAPPPRQPGFDLPELTPEVTPVENFYIMSKTVNQPSIPEDWSLRITGRVDRELRLTLADLLNFPRLDEYVTLQCISNPVGGPLMSTALMSGASLADLLAAAGVQPEAQAVVLVGRDTFVDSVPLQPSEPGRPYGLQESALVVYGMNGQWLPPAHGAPARSLVPGLYGFKNVKWLERIEVVDHEVRGRWQELGWSSTAVIKTTSRIDAVVPAADGAVACGIAFAGLRGIARVEVQVNDGPWRMAELHQPPLSTLSWVQWRFRLEERGKLRLTVRAIDGQGQMQPDELEQPFPNGASGWQQLEVIL